MGFDRQTNIYSCGCYYEYLSHDFFNYNKDHIFLNICGKHSTESQAMADQIREKETEILKLATDVLCKNMKSEKMIPHLRQRHVLSKEKEDSLLQITNNAQRTRELISHLFNAEQLAFQQLRIAVIKAGQSYLLKYLSEDYAADLESYDGRCFIQLQGDCYVVAKEFKETMYIHIRNYFKRGSAKLPSKQGVALTMSRWLLLEKKRQEITDLYEKALNNTLEEEEYVVHLGGGIQVTVSRNYPTIDIRQFWKPEESDKPAPTKKGVALNKFKWSRLCDVMDLIRDFVPELNEAIICKETHTDEIELLACKECYPFEETDENHDTQILQ